MTPEEMEFLLELGQVPDQEANLALRMQQIQRLRDQKSSFPNTGFGALAGGLFDASRGLLAGFQEGQLVGEQKRLLERKQKGRQAGLKLAATTSSPDLSGLMDPSADPAALHAREQQIGQAIGEREQAAQALMASRDPELVARGQSMLQEIQQAKRLLLSAPGEREDRRLRRERFDADRIRADAEFAERARHNRAVESMGRGPPLQIVLGEGGAQYFVDPRNPGAPARPITGPDGQPITKPTKGRPLLSSDRDKLEELSNQYQAIDSLERTFKDEFAGKGPLGPAGTKIDATLGSWGTEKQQQNALFWAEVEKLVNLPERNEVFGASLSPTEKQSWDEAKSITPRADPDKVRAAFAKMKRIVANKANDRAQSLVADSYDPEAMKPFLRPMTGGAQVAQGAPASAPGPVRRTDPVTGETRVWNGSKWVAE